MSDTKAILDYAPPPKRRLFTFLMPPILLLVTFCIIQSGLEAICVFAVLLIIAILAGFHRKSCILALALLPIAPTCSFARGVFEYQSGTATYHVRGLMRGRIHNPEMLTRCNIQSGGCMVDSYREMMDQTHNAAITFMTRHFGPMRGTYDGPYPTRADIETALPSAVPINLTDLPADRIIIGPDTITLAPAIGSALLSQFRAGPASDPANPKLLSEFGPAKAVIIATRCVVLVIPTESIAATAGRSPRNHQVFILIDRTAGRPFAYYKDSPKEFYATVGYR